MGLELIKARNGNGQNLGKAKNKEDFLAAAKAERQKFNAEEYDFDLLNENLSESLDVFYDLKKTPHVKPVEEEKRKARRELSEKADQKLHENAADYLYGHYPQEKEGRYPRELMMKPGFSNEAIQYNDKLADCLNNPKEHASELIGYHYALLKKFEDMGPEKLAGPMSDEDLVEKHANNVLFAAKTCLQMSNIREYFRKNNIQAVNEEDKKNLDEINRIMEQYGDLARKLDENKKRLEVLANPLYELIDETDPEVKMISGGEFVKVQTAGLFDYNNDDKEKTWYYGKSLSQELFDCLKELTMLRQEREIDTAFDIMEERGVDSENLQYKIITGGKVSEPQAASDKKVIASEMIQHNDARVILFDKNHPENQVVMFASTNGELSNLVHFGAKPDMKEPTRPGMIARLLHWMNNNYRKADFDRYYQEKSLYDVNRKLLEKEAGKSKAAQPAREDTHEKAKENREKVKDLQNQKIKEINEQIVAHGGEPEPENTVKEEKSQPLPDGLNVNAESKTNEKLP